MQTIPTDRQEQVDAARREFKDLWRAELLIAFTELTPLPSRQTIAAAEHIAWNAFRKAKGL